MLNMEFDHSCRYDYVEVRDGDSMDSRVIGRYCGNESPPPIRSSGDSLRIRFVSDGYNNFDGFFATFQESSGETLFNEYSLSLTAQIYSLKWLFKLPHFITRETVFMCFTVYFGFRIETFC